MDGRLSFFWVAKDKIWKTLEEVRKREYVVGGCRRIVYTPKFDAFLSETVRGDAH